MNAKRKETNIISIQSTLHDKLIEYRMLQEEAKVNRQRQTVLQKELIAMLGRMPSEGTAHKTVEDLAVTVSSRVKRTLDQDKVRHAITLLPKEVAGRVFPSVHKLSVRELHYMEEHEPDNYRIVRATFTASKGSPTIKVEVK